MKIKNALYIILFAVFLSACEKVSDSSSNANNGNGNGANGSLTRFITVNNFLYIVDNRSLKAYDISNGALPLLKITTDVGFAIQTIFSYTDKLFIGSNSEMFIYSIANPAQPAFVSSVPYFVRGKDPVVAVDSVAYSTVRNFNSGVLNIFNIKDIKNPILLSRIPQPGPYGLGLKDSALYVCNADSGLNVYNVKNTYLPVIASKIKNGDSFYDVIISGNLMICYLGKGISFYNITDPYNPIQVSKLVN